MSNESKDTRSQNRLMFRAISCAAALLPSVPGMRAAYVSIIELVKRSVEVTVS